MSEGTIKRIVGDKGFGFIEQEGSDKDLFFHAKECDGKFDDFQEGHRVTFEEGTSDKGPRAERVQLV